MAGLPGLAGTCNAPALSGLTSEGSIAALDTRGLTARANFLWLRCQR
jgi:hypothetical protein